MGRQRLVTPFEIGLETCFWPKDARVFTPMEGMPHLPWCPQDMPGAGHGDRCLHCGNLLLLYVWVSLWAVSFVAFLSTWVSIGSADWQRMGSHPPQRDASSLDLEESLHTITLLFQFISSSPTVKHSLKKRVSTFTFASFWRLKMLSFTLPFCKLSH